MASEQTDTATESPMILANKNADVLATHMIRDYGDTLRRCDEETRRLLQCYLFSFVEDYVAELSALRRANADLVRERDELRADIARVVSERSGNGMVKAVILLAKKYTKDGNCTCCIGRGDHWGPSDERERCPVHGTKAAKYPNNTKEA